MNVIQERRCGTNSPGTEVQHLTPNGWKACSLVFRTDGEAEAHMATLLRAGTEFRIYPAIDRREA